MRSYRIAGATVNQTPLDWSNNIAHLKQVIKLAKEAKVEILCLPELAITAYGCEDLFLSEWLPEKAKSFLPALIAETEGILTTLNLPVRHEGKLYNCSVVVQNKAILGVYAKQYMALDGVHYEPRWFNPWPVGVVKEIELFGESYPIGDITFDIEDWKLGFEICEDAWRGKDRPACRLFEKGVNLILNPSASHFAMGKTHERIELVANSSKSFACTYVYANLLGNEAGRMIYDGEIMIAQHGKMHLRSKLLSFKDVHVDWVDIAPDQSIAPSPEKTAPVIPKEEEFPQASALALYDYLRKSRSNGYTLSLSGGADSATCAVMVAEMVRRGIDEIGKNAFLAKINRGDWQGLTEKEIVGKLFNTAYQGTVNSSDTTLNAAKTLAESIGAKFYNWTIDDSVKAYTSTIEDVLERKLTWEQDDLALQNIQARARSPIIWMLTNITNTLLLTTSNRSEGDVGYATMDGDTSGSLAPISSVDKHYIRQWLHYAEKELGYSGLAPINVLPPTAELRPSDQKQTDEDDLMPYHIMVEIERLAIKDHLSPKEAFELLAKEDLEPADLLKTHIIKFYKLWSRNQWKRERLAPAFHLDEFNVDPRTWCRFPILSAGFIEELQEL
ncbi:NAD(+) synthase [Roseivirga pacifica]|uniref:NAD(+) synthase n=1 Tax=Roseivirga pacifica TaxID=1267423 RepID=UPI002095BA0A|nr:NAD(+) synthase [Roseivirga pacifica]MCO6357991.1 NAD(+) synthase [Roseivirga pacifica]MCO6366430.1 NAD(+) synthase [Roseivirga pacifica]MCO6370915.1 NAD(+) synthase [Roseivirga pacifica]MCO6373723.1 NAD(+) synthase [Roseivirga pacifica]MCO6380704.1 NAD(+) synthase [Roseivirga pacifica]